MTTTAAPGDKVELPTFDPRNYRLLATMEASGNENPPHEQLGILVMALVLTARRLLKTNGISDRGRRRKILKMLVVEVDARLRRYVADPSVVIVEEAQGEALAGVTAKDLTEGPAAG